MLTKKEKLSALENSGFENVRALVDTVGAENALSIIQTFGGAYLYIPSPDTIFMGKRNEHILRDFIGGVKVNVLSEKYGLSYAGILKIIRKYKEDSNK